MLFLRAFVGVLHLSLASPLGQKASRNSWDHTFPVQSSLNAPRAATALSSAELLAVTTGLTVSAAANATRPISPRSQASSISPAENANQERPANDTDTIVTHPAGSVLMLRPQLWNDTCGTVGVNGWTTALCYQVASEAYEASVNGTPFFTSSNGAVFPLLQTKAGAIQSRTDMEKHIQWAKPPSNHTHGPSWKTIVPATIGGMMAATGLGVLSARCIPLVGPLANRVLAKAPWFPGPDRAKPAAAAPKPQAPEVGGGRAEGSGSTPQAPAPGAAALDAAALGTAALDTAWNMEYWEFHALGIALAEANFARDIGYALPTDGLSKTLASIYKDRAKGSILEFSPGVFMDADAVNRLERAFIERETTRDPSLRDKAKRPLDSYFKEVLDHWRYADDPLNPAKSSKGKIGSLGVIQESPAEGSGQDEAKSPSSPAQSSSKLPPSGSGASGSSATSQSVPLTSTSSLTTGSSVTSPSASLYTSHSVMSSTSSGHASASASTSFSTGSPSSKASSNPILELVTWDECTTCATSLTNEFQKLDALQDAYEATIAREHADWIKNRYIPPRAHQPSLDVRRVFAIAEIPVILKQIFPTTNPSNKVHKTTVKATESEWTATIMEWSSRETVAAATLRQSYEKYARSQDELVEQERSCKATVAKLTDCVHSIEGILKEQHSAWTNLTQFHPASISCTPPSQTLGDATSDLTSCQANLEFARNVDWAALHAPAPQPDRPNKPRMSKCEDMAQKILFCHDHPYAPLHRDWWDLHSETWTWPDRFRCSIGRLAYKGVFVLKGCCTKSKGTLKHEGVKRACRIV